MAAKNFDIPDLRVSNSVAFAGAFAVNGATPVTQMATSGEAVGVSAGNGATNANLANVNFNGNSGNSAYTIGDIVKCLKRAGLLAS